MEGFAVYGPPIKPRFKSTAEIREDAFSRVTDKDIERRIVKLKADANIAMNNIDKALALTTSHTRRHDEWNLRHARLTTRLEYSHHPGGRIMDVR